jgi:DNA polymerase-3 subunit gamma/tau
MQDTEQKTSYQGLSRIYRPQTFGSVLGQEAIVSTLKNAIKQKKTANAYIFCGTRGTGKTTLARVLAKALNCKNLSENLEPCNTCSSCIEISQGKNLNVFEIDGASNRGIDDIRALHETISYAPTAFGCKIFIIDEAHMLTKEAFNALLKTLEEPPPNVKFFLATTEPHKIPPTITSRCQRFDLQRIPSSLILQKLRQIADIQSVSYEVEALHRIASLSDGSMRVAESLLDQILCFSEGPLTESGVCFSLATLPTESFFEFDKAFGTYDLRFAFVWAGTIFSSGKDLSHFFDCLLEHYRNILKAQMQIPLEEMPSSLQEKYQMTAGLYTEEQALYILDYLLSWHESVNKTPFKRVSLEMVLLHILKSKYRVSAIDLVTRLENMKESSVGIKSEERPLIKQTPPTAIKAPTSNPQTVTDATISLKNQEKPVSIKRETTPVETKKTKEEEEKSALNLTANTPTTQSPSYKPKDVTAKEETLMRFAAVELEGILTKE